MIASRLYKQGKDNILWLCIEKEEIVSYVQEAHVTMGNVHQHLKKTLQRRECMGVYWPSMRKDVYDYTRGCSCEMGAANLVAVNAITLYQPSPIALKWADILVEYLTTRVIPEKMSKKRQRYLEKYAEEFSSIANQLYHRVKDGNLRICVTKSEYVPVLTHAHSYAFDGHFSMDVTTKAIMRAGLWWLTFHKDAAKFVKQCNECQR